MEKTAHYLVAFFVSIFVFTLFVVSGWYFAYESFVPDVTVEVDRFEFFNRSVVLSSPEVAAYGGLVIAFLLSLIVFLLIARRKAAEDIAESLAEDALSSRELFVKLYDSSPVPYLLLSSEGVMTYPNNAAVRFFAETKEQLSGKKLFDYISSGEVDQQAEVHVSTLPTRYRQGVSIADEEVLVTRGDGKERWVLLSIFPVQQERGKHTGIATVVDITKQKEIERAKTEFVSLASHQLKTPISVAKWNSELLESPSHGQLTPKQSEYLEKVKGAVERLKNIIDDFLEVSRLDLKTAQIEKEEVLISDLIREIITELSTRTGHNTNIEQHITVESVQTSRKYMRMVLENLISNAMKYTPEGGEIKLVAKQEGSNLHIAIADTGRGIPEDEQEHLFSKMFRAKNVKEEVPDGTGLGLYIVKKIVEALDGTIDFQSEEGVGTTFTVLLPLS